LVIDTKHIPVLDFQFTLITTSTVIPEISSDNMQSLITLNPNLRNV